MQYHKNLVFPLISIFIFFVCVNGFAGEDKNITRQTLEKESLEKQISYALGFDIFDKLKANFKLDLDYFKLGATDSHEKHAKFTHEKLQQTLMAYQRMARQKQMETIQMESKKNREEGLRFLSDNKLKQGVVTLSSGLQYRSIIEGKGAVPKAGDTVECHYKGTLIDGTVFDSSYKRGKPATFQVSGVIKGWVEALQMMKVGSKWELFIPPDLAYGDRGAGGVIKPGSTLVFEVELLGIVE